MVVATVVDPDLRIQHRGHLEEPEADRLECFQVPWSTGTHETMGILIGTGNGGESLRLDHAGYRGINPLPLNSFRKSEQVY